MSDPVAMALIAGAVTVIQGAFTLLSGRKTRTKVAEVHDLVNSRSTRQDEKIDEQHKEIVQLVKEAK